MMMMMMKKITYVLLAPLLFPLWCTLPDTRGAKGKTKWQHCNPI